MIYYLATREAAYTMQIHKDMWAGPDLRHRIQIICYDQIVHYRHLPAAMFIFSDLERLGPVEMEFAGSVWQQLQSSGSNVRLMNDPSKVLRRESFLRALHATGMNPFAVHRVGDDLSRVRYPAFVRRDSGHTGSLTELLNCSADVSAAIETLRRDGVPDSDILIVEFCDTGDSTGTYRKYSAFRVGDQLMARHLLFSKRWMLKYSDLVDDATVAEEREYLNTHPHREQLLKIFQVANIDYGRIDYSVLNGQLVTWEINTNPMVSIEPMKVAADRLPLHAGFMKQYNAAMIDADVDAKGVMIPLKFSTALKRNLGIGPRDEALRWVGKALKRLAKLPPLRHALEAASP